MVSGTMEKREDVGGGRIDKARIPPALHAQCIPNKNERRMDAKRSLEEEKKSNSKVGAQHQSQERPLGAWCWHKRHRRTRSGNACRRLWSIGTRRREKRITSRSMELGETADDDVCGKDVNEESRMRSCVSRVYL